MEKFAFLSDEWTEAVRRLHDEVLTEPVQSEHGVRMNLVLTDSPLSQSVLDAHLDTSSGDLVVDTGHLESPDLTVTVDYETAKAILVEGDTQAAMQAFMSGRIRIDGDVSQLLALQHTPVDPVHQELARRIREITK